MITEFIVTEEDNLNWFNNLTDDEKYNFNLKTYRAFRNNKLKSTDTLVKVL